MSDRIINSALWLTIMGMVCFMACGGLIIGYCSLYQLAAMQWKPGLIGVAAATLCFCLTMVMCRHREDLV
jgi:hypothetical protein